MKLMLTPCPGTGRSWRIGLELSCVELDADVGERVRRGELEWTGSRYRRDERLSALDRARAVAKELGLTTEVEHDDSHWTWTR